MELILRTLLLERSFGLNLQRKRKKKNNYKFHTLVSKDEERYLEAIDEVEDIWEGFQHDRVSPHIGN